MREITEDHQTLPIERIVRPFREFTKLEAAGGILLLFSTIVALVWANSPFSNSYYNLWQTKLTVGVGVFALDKPLILWINEGLMAMFFFLIGLEIKRELLVGELSTPKKAALPIMAALGGIAVPAAIYFMLNAGKPGAQGWGVPVATDIAFALGVLALLGKGIPLSLKVFLTSLAIVDDIGAVLIIALFYASEISLVSLSIGALFLILLIGANQAHVRSPLVYAALGIGGLWIAFLMSGIHATIAGVLAAMTIPAKTRINAQEFLNNSKYFLEKFETASEEGKNVLTNKLQLAAAESVERASELIQTPLQRLEHSLHPWVIFGVMPLFALANAGVTLEGDLLEAFTHPVTIGIVLGLFIGKQLGITLFSWVAIRLGLATMPSEVNWKKIYGTSCLAGIGFTMSIFIADLAFNNIQLLSLAKLGILAASLIAGITGFIILSRSLNTKR